MNVKEHILLKKSVNTGVQFEIGTVWSGSCTSQAHGKVLGRIIYEKSDLKFNPRLYIQLLKNCEAWSTSTYI